MSSTEENKRITRLICEEIINKGNIDKADEVIAEDMRNHDPANPAQGREGFKRFFELFRAAFPDVQNTIEDIIAEGNTVVARVTIRATHTGEFMGIPPTGRKIETSVIDILRFKDGVVVEHWAQVDQLTMLRQLGLTPSGA
jgi:steroid delta-isomerase-like uncharacterized protein